MVLSAISGNSPVYQPASDRQAGGSAAPAQNKSQLPQDTVTLSARATASSPSVDVDHDGDSH